MNKLIDAENIELLVNEIENSNYNRNFGIFSKNDYDVLIFTVYLRSLENRDEPVDDYSLSKKLGISQVRVRNLKQKSELKYPSNKKWYEKIEKHIKSSSYKDGNLRFIIDDINIKNEFEHYMEENGCYYDFSFNSKIIVFPVDEFFSLFNNKKDDYIKIFSSSIRHKIKKDNPKYSQISEILETATKENIRDVIKMLSKTLLIDAMKHFVKEVGFKSEINWLISVLEQSD